MQDLDKEELEYTRNMREINKIISPEEKTADKMFEELGYEKIDYTNSIDKTFIEYIKHFKLKRDRIIAFYLDKTIAVFEEIAHKDCFTMQELQAINKKVEELGWKK